MTRDTEAAPSAESVPSNEAPASSRGINLSSQRDDWGSPQSFLDFAAVTLKPASRGSTSIDMDACTNAYWMRWWRDEDRPATFLDGTPGADMFDPDSWVKRRRCYSSKRGEVETVGTVFKNPPGDPSGGNVQDAWEILARQCMQRHVDSGMWVGFNIEQCRTLIPDDVELLHPLCDRVTTIVPSRRAQYRASPRDILALIEERLKRPSKDAKSLIKRADKMRQMIADGNDAPVPGPAPTHSSFITIIWSQDGNIIRQQKAAAKKFLLTERKNPRSVFERAVVIGVQL